MYIVTDLIRKKSEGKTLTNDELKFMINGYLTEEVAQHQMSAFLMAIKIKGLEDSEILQLVDLYVESGKRISFGDDIFVVDKHSTGGVGDKISIILTPLVASMGLNIGKLSGRGLGYTGGTVDKLESIPGFDIEMAMEDFINHVEKDGMALIGQTKDLCIADKKIYSLRDATATVSSIGLIVASIMSKKLASGANSILIDLKTGTGGFFKSPEMEKDFARLAIEIGKNNNVDTRILFSNMNQPLGHNIGNINELVEAHDVLNGKGPKDVIELVTYQAGIMYTQANPKSKLEDAIKLANDNLNNGKANEYFEK
jgi:pyrimidine-nucleoside phosphorylase